MKTHILLIMTPNMSLAAWSRAGQLSRELDIYSRLASRLKLRLMILSYGRADTSYLPAKTDITLLEMPGWIPARLPFSLQNLFYHLCIPLIFYSDLKKIAFSKTNQYAAAQIGLLLSLIYRVPLVVRMGYYHGHITRPTFLKALIEKCVFRLCHGILITSIDAQRYISRQYEISDCKMTTILNNIDRERFRPIKTEKEYDLIFVGRLATVKNISLLTAFLISTNLKVHIIGNGPLADDIVRVMQIKPNVTWSRRVDNVQLPGYYNKAKLFLLISKYEGNPKSLLEAMACGIPCVGTDVAGIRECIRNGETGILVAQNLESLNQGIYKLLDDEALAQRVSSNALEWVAYNCDMQTNISREANFYEHLGYPVSQHREFIQT